MSRVRLPLFPLPLVLFPGARQLLHIFEPRYRDLLADCLSADKRFGISYVERGDDQDPEPAPGEVGCVAFVTAHRPLPDGCSNILTVGQERYVVREVVRGDRSYQVAHVDVFDDDPQTSADLHDLPDRLRLSFAQFVAAVRVLDDAELPDDDVPSEAKALSFHVAASVEADPSVKQHLLSMTSTRDRLYTLERILQPLNTELRERAAVRMRAKKNGSGGRYHSSPAR